MASPVDCFSQFPPLSWRSLLRAGWRSYGG